MPNNSKTQLYELLIYDFIKWGVYKEASTQQYKSRKG